MIRFRRMIVALLALSLAIVPTAAGAYAAAMAATAASQSTNCSPYPMMHAAEGMVGMPMAVPSGCHETEGGPMTLAACAVFCSGLVALPSPAFAMADVVSAKLLNPHVELTLACYIDPPEPHPPKP
jgi:hypothetical protein